jgi:hypothetical protein
MTEEERRARFAAAFVEQARSDWSVYRLLASQADVKPCHSLHYLQMACEKLAKAYRLRDTASPVDELVKRHTGFAKFVGPYFTAVLRPDYKNKDAQLGVVIQQARTIAREIEKLAPAIDRVSSPENAEYPWESGEKVVAPCSHGFPALELLRQAGGRAFLNLVARALDGFPASAS